MTFFLEKKEEEEEVQFDIYVRQYISALYKVYKLVQPRPIRTSCTITLKWTTQDYLRNLDEDYSGNELAI